ncbi:recombinase family protein [Rhizobium tropici]|uniref:Recombinase family protein n=1 Tax=Rhizobium tropici TaxID=398 RepID=A0A329Y938_RHITR|nr:recombinase family protein [Rhizobium tropici]
MILSYARVSTDANDLAIHNDQLTATSCERIFDDNVSGPRPTGSSLRSLAPICHEA